MAMHLSDWSLRCHVRRPWALDWNGQLSGKMMMYWPLSRATRHGFYRRTNLWRAPRGHNRVTHQSVAMQPEVPPGSSLNCVRHPSQTDAIMAVDILGRSDVANTVRVGNIFGRNLEGNTPY